MGSDAAVRPQMFSNGLDSAASSRLDRWALARIQQSVASAPLRFLLWDGYELAPRTGAPVATIVFRNRRALFSWVWNPDLYFGEAYMFGAVEIRGDLVRTLEAVYRALASAERAWWQLRGSNSVEAARDRSLRWSLISAARSDASTTCAVVRTARGTPSASPRAAS